MYVPPVFKTDDATAWGLVEARRFGTLIAVDQGFPVASHLPFLIDRTADTARLELHVARGNPLHEILARAPNVLLIVQGPDAYVSPDWYASADQVPTWNYVSVHLSGVAQVLPESETLRHVDALSAAFEAELAPKPPWLSTKMTPAKRAAMLTAIVAFAVRVTRIEAQVKLAQHKSRADRIEAARLLADRGRPGDLALAEAMVASLQE